MVATFVVETGAIVSGANSYLSEADADLYFENYGNPTTWTSLSSAQKQEALRFATQYLDMTYGPIKRGRKVSGVQPLEWPVRYAEDDDGYIIPSDSIPTNLKNATAEVAHRHVTETAASSSLVPDVENPGSTKSVYEKLDVLETRTVYHGSGSLKQYTAVERLMRPLIVTGGRSALA